MSELVIRNLHVSIEGKEILKGLGNRFGKGSPCYYGPERNGQVDPGLA